MGCSSLKSKIKSYTDTSRVDSLSNINSKILKDIKFPKGKKLLMKRNQQQ